LKRKFRLRSTTEFKRVRQIGKSYAHPLVVLIFEPGNEGLKIGITAGRSVGKAVERNRAKRRLWAAAEHWLPQISGEGNLVLVARQPCLQAEWSELLDVIKSLLLRARLIKNPEA